MTFQLSDLKETIYLGTSGTLASRIDYAWDVYSTEYNPPLKPEDLKNALGFLIYAFNIRNLSNINRQLSTLMAERERYKHQNPEYIPGKQPKHLILNQEQEDSLKSMIKVKEAIEKNELLAVNDRSKKLDLNEVTRSLKPDERAKQRVDIYKGEFVKDMGYFDTSQMISHGKKGYAAYTLNIHGELSVFNHHGMTDNIAHSSMNAGAPVIAAGELKITDGKLKAITTHSGHYKPSLFNVYRVLEYFVDNGVDISKTKVNLWENPQKKGINIDCTPERFPAYKNRTLYIAKASDIYINVKAIINNQIASIQKTMNQYVEDKLVNTIYRIKDIVIGSDLTEQRNILAKEFEQELSTFKKGMIKFLPDELEIKIRKLSQLITKFQEKNNKLSMQSGKESDTGRLAQKMRSFKNELEKISLEINKKSIARTEDMKLTR